MSIKSSSDDKNGYIDPESEKRRRDVEHKETDIWVFLAIMFIVALLLIIFV